MDNKEFLNLINFKRTMQTHLCQLEVHLADHCNLNCRSCDHYSPLSKECFPNFEKVEKDLAHNIKAIEENDTVGIIICKQDNKYVIKYCSDDKIIAREYELV